MDAVLEMQTLKLNGIGNVWFEVNENGQAVMDMAHLLEIVNAVNAARVNDMSEAYRDGFADGILD